MATKCLVLAVTWWVSIVVAAVDIGSAQVRGGPAVGLGYSGGGISGIINAMCAHHTLIDLVSLSEDVVVSTASGGTLGYLLHQTLGDKLSFPPALGPNLTFEELSSRQAPDGKKWFAEVVDYLPTLLPTKAVHSDSFATSSCSSCSPRPNSREGWWQDVMATLFSVGYGIPSKQAGILGVGHFVQNFAMIKAAALPMKRYANGVMAGAQESLRYASLEAIPGNTDLHPSRYLWTI